MNLDTFRRLLTPIGQAVLATAEALSPTEESFLPHLTRLQKEFDTELARAVLETVLLRSRARAKFSRADWMYFTREGLEQASGEVVSVYRAGRYSGYARVADLACGLGGDSIGLAQAAHVTAVDRDPLRLEMADANLKAYGLGERMTFLEQNLLAQSLPEAEAYFFDPGRREQARRIFSVEEYQPPLSILRRWLPQAPAFGVKVSPGVNLAELSDYDCEVEFISFQGDLKEAALWFGPLKRGAHNARRATLLPSGETLAADLSAVEPVPITDPAEFLYEPDPAVIRAGLVELLGTWLGASKIDADIAYLVADRHVPTPFARAYRVDEVHPFQLKRLRERLRALNVGRITVKKRGSPIEPEELIHRLKLTGSAEKTLVLTHVKGRPFVLIVRPVEAWPRFRLADSSSLC